MTNQDSELDNILSKHVWKPLTTWEQLEQAILAWHTAEVRKAREEQIMQDFLSLSLDYSDQIDESDLITWRQDRLEQIEVKAQLSNENKEER